MDKLVKYIETRMKKYGHIKGEQCISSNYYTFTDKIVRISDHVKYSLNNAKKVDYTFIIQPNDMYLFYVSPKYNSEQMNKMFLKIVTLQEAKNFIRRLHDFSLSLESLSDIYSPEGWNRGNSDVYDKPSWEEFWNTYSNIDGKTPLNVLNIIENIYTGSNSKGNVDTKIDKVSEMYEMMSLTQYETLIEKLKK